MGGHACFSTVQVRGQHHGAFTLSSTSTRVQAHSQLVGLAWQAPGPLRLCPRADTAIETPILTSVLSWEHWRRCFFTEILQAYVQRSSSRFLPLTHLPLLVYANYSWGPQDTKGRVRMDKSQDLQRQSTAPGHTPPLLCPSHHEKLY